MINTKGSFLNNLYDYLGLRPFVAYILMRPKSIFVIFLVIVSAVSLLFFNNTLNKKRVSSQYLDTAGIGQETEPSINYPLSIDIEKEKKYWTGRINAVGASKAYQELKDKYSAQSDGIAHLQVHLFGEALYKKTGLSGITICDVSFAFGCFHSFAGGAIRDKGKSVLVDIDKHCNSKFGSEATACQHGIGHGVLEAFGYKRLLDALDACSTIQKNPLYGCISGVFMEYNLLTMVSLRDKYANFKIRKFDKAKPYDPCPDLSPNFRPGCYHELGQWWDKIYNGDYEKLGALCKDVANKDERRACFLGIGMIVGPASNYDVKSAKEKCNKIPIEEGKQYCSIEASWSFFASAKHQSKAYQLCLDFPGNIKQNCAGQVK